MLLQYTCIDDVIESYARFYWLKCFRGIFLVNMCDECIILEEILRDVCAILFARLRLHDLILNDIHLVFIGLKAMVNTLLKSIMMLSDVLILTTFFLCVFALIGLQFLYLMR